MDRSYRRAEALPHVVQALRAGIASGGDRRAEALPHVVQALRAGIASGGDRRAEALPHVVQALRAGIASGGDRRAKALPHVVQALRAGINQASLRQGEGDGRHSPAGAFTPSERASARPFIARKNCGAGVMQGSTAKSVGERRDRRAKALPHVVQALRAGIASGGDRRANGD